MVIALMMIPGCGREALAAPPAGVGPPLGRAHALLTFGRADFDDEAARAWGVNREDFLSLEVYGGGDDGFYFGGEIGNVGVDRAVTDDGDTIRDFDLLWLEMNGKKVFGLKHGFSAHLGLGSSLFYVEGEEVSMLGGFEVADPLADIGFGLQGFAGLDWRARRFVIGVGAKYQWAIDVIDVDYSNLRIAGHIGIVF
jgi:hypothetical protein